MKDALKNKWSIVGIVISLLFLCGIPLMITVLAVAWAMANNYSSEGTELLGRMSAPYILGSVCTGFVALICTVVFIIIKFSSKNK